MRRCFRLFMVLGFVSALFGSAGQAQDRPSGLKLDLFGQGTQPGEASSEDPFAAAPSPAKVDLVPADARPGEKVKVRITLELPPGSRTYSQDPGFSGAARIQLEEFKGVEPLQEKFVPDHPPKRSFDPDFKQEVEKFFGQVVWTREFRILPDAEKVSFKGVAKYQICDARSCVPYDTPIDLEFTPKSTAEPKTPNPSIVHPFSFKERPKAMGTPGKV
jgi:DsbC/DsbD-like thiol-disulfide interchange protein